MGSPLDQTTPIGVTDETTDTERAIFGTGSPAEVLSLFTAYTRERLGSPIAKVRFRAGRIDAVWGVELDDGREVVIKGHRQPADIDAIATAREAQRVLRTADFPCPEPLSGPDEVDGRILSVETLVGDGAAPDASEQGNRELLAAGLAWHIDVLRNESDLVLRAGSGPSWCQYQAGPWPVPHDPIVDFSATPEGYAWLDVHAQRAADQILTHRDADQLVAGHADWYGGNVAVADGRLVATFDWELVADAEAVIAGFTAACFAASSTSGAGLSTPEDVVAFLRDYEAARGTRLSRSEQRAAAGAAAWILAFNARWEVGMLRPGSPDGPTSALVRERQHDYLSLAW